MQPIHGFVEKQTIQLPEYRATGGWFEHEKSGCEVFHVFNDDEENLFAFAFKTIPSDSTGVAHILEHTVLSGSKSFPLKDPFLLLLKGSLQTFLNAFTFPDKTVYPAASAVEADLFNLMRVYGDAVFFPLMRPESFRQEGHRLEITEQGELNLTGIVYNEMRGNYADHDSIAAEWSVRSVMPDTPYAYDSGGDPAAIPRLTYEQFVEFHKRYYHPSNTRIFLYGNIPTERYLQYLDETFLSKFSRSEPPQTSLEQSRWSEPRELSVTCPSDSDESTTSVYISWLLDSITDPVELLAAELLSHILLASSASPLRKRLIESGLGDDLAAPSGLESEVYQMVFSVGLRGTQAEHGQEIEKLIDDELRRLAAEGIDPDIIEGALRKVEFRNREIKGGMPNGLRLMRKSLRGWLHGQEPQATMRFAEPFGRLREAYASDPSYFSALIRKWLLDNPHHATVTVLPDPEQAEREKAELDAWLAEQLESMDEQRKGQLREEQEALLKMQQTPDDEAAVRSIPFLSIDDLPKQIESIPTEELRLAADVPAYVHDLYTNGITYIDLAFDVTGLPQELIRHMSFYSSVLTEVGLPGRSYDQVATQLSLLAGGASGGVEAALPFHEPRLSDRRFTFRLRALDVMVDQALDLIGELLTSATHDNATRVAELLREDRSEMASSVLPGGHRYAALRSRALLSDASYYDEQWRGIDQLQFLRSLDPSADAEKVGNALSSINHEVVRRGNLTINITAEGGAIARARRAVDRLIERLPDGGFTSRVDHGSVDGTSRQESVVVPSGVNYVAASLLASRLGSPEQVHESILAHLLSTGYLWQEIRMTGGAYGAFAAARGMDALFTFATYRDPRLLESIAAFRTGLETYASATASADELEPAILGVTGNDIRPLSPGEKSWIAFHRSLAGVTDELRQERRDSLLSATGRQIRSAAERLLGGFDSASIAVVGGREAVEAAAAEYPGLTQNLTEISL